MVAIIWKLVLKLLFGKAGFVLFAGKNIVGGVLCCMTVSTVEEALWKAAPWGSATLADALWYGLAPMIDFGKVRRSIGLPAIQLPEISSAE